MAGQSINLLPVRGNTDVAISPHPQFYDLKIYCIPASRLRELIDQDDSTLAQSWPSVQTRQYRNGYFLVQR